MKTDEATQERPGQGRAAEAERPADWTPADEGLWRLCCELRQVRAEGAALLARWEAGEELALRAQRALLREALDLGDLGRELVAEFGGRSSGAGG